MNKSRLLFIILFTYIALVGCNNESKEEDTPEFVVETTFGNITKEEFYKSLKNRFGEEVLRELVYEKVLTHQFNLTDEEVIERFDEFKEDLGAQFEAALMRSGFKSEEQFKKTLRTAMLQEKAAMELVEVTDEELLAYYDNIQLPIKANHILVDDEETALLLIEKLEEGADFSQLAKENSTDPATAEAGGDLGWFGPGKMLEQFEKTAFSLEVGEISDPVETIYGYHIIKVVDIEERQPFEQMKDQLREEVIKEKINQELINEAVQKHLDEANVKVNDPSLKEAFDLSEY
ncbi:peptidylprolyl isomerase [Bacillus sp. FJAT-45066]|uniref:peptidylprolyl isomerase n=1 Tax=Bacillus sp. FJAT-45066 TaxID=2011010 RepID=UPI000BB6BE56|nr:peptidylprolyl isomerase [Bacillus sp. FJAT-45066]